MKQNIAIIGGGSLGQQIQHQFDSNPELKFVGFYDDQLADKERIGPISQLFKDHTKVFDAVVIGIGYNHFGFRAELYNKLTSANVPLTTLVHPTAVIHPTATIHPGSIIFPSVVVDQFSEIKENVFLNTGCIICHHTTIGAHSFVAPAAAIAGHVTLGTKCFVGINATILDNLTLTESVTVGAGSVVTKNLTPGIYKGVPAKRYTC